jgi:SDR family mycofactocin-dependent oxidoreductase
VGRLDGKVVFVTGAARGVGRSIAVRMAQEGADVIAVDIAAQIDTVPYPMGTPEDLRETVRQVEAQGRHIVAAHADVRDYPSLKAALDGGVAELGRLDIVCANAGIFSAGPVEALAENTWNDMLDVNVTGVWHTVKAAIPHLRAGGRGGAIILTNSVNGIKPSLGLGHYVAAKHGVVGLMRTLALELAPEMIRVNTVHPTVINTPMLQNSAIYALFAPDLLVEERTPETIGMRFAPLNALPINWIEPLDVANVALFLASDEARYITGITLPVDAGALIK